MNKARIYLCVCLCVLASLAAPARGNSILIRNIYWVYGEQVRMHAKATLSDLIVYGDPNDPDPDTGKRKEKVLLKPNDPRDDIVVEPSGTKIFHVDFKITEFEISTLYKDSERPADWGIPAFVGEIIVPKKVKKVGFIRDPDGQQTVVLAVDQAVAPEPPPVGTILAFVDGYNELMPGWFVGTDINFDTGEVTGAYTGNVEVFSIPFEVLVFTAPYPADGAVGLRLDDDLFWPKSERAESYEVYFGTNFDDVKRGRGGTFKGSQSATTYDPGTLEPCRTYYWKIDGCFSEVEEVEVGEFIIIEEHEVRDEGPLWSFTTGPAKATNPHPAHGAINVDPNMLLSWMPGCGADFHDMYFGTDFYAVANADTSDTTGIYWGRLDADANSYDPGTLEPGTAYYWKIDEVVPTVDGPPIIHEGDVWSFTTADYLFMDDMESYNMLPLDDPNSNRIFETWHDGYGYGDLELGYLGNGTGSRVRLRIGIEEIYEEEAGEEAADQVMDFHYDNTGTAKNIFGDPISANYSETERTFDTPQDWTKHGVKALSLLFRGYPGSVGSFTEGPVGTYTMTAAGADISGTSDQFHYAFRPLAGDGSAVVHIVSMDIKDEWAKAGLMIRETLDSNSEHAMIAMTGMHGVQTVWRQETGGSSADVTTGGVGAPCWIRIERFGDRIDTYYSPDGSMWTPHQSLTIPMSPTVYVGLGLCPAQSDALATAVFSNLTTSGNISSVWINQDIGIVTNDPEPMYVAVEDTTGMSAVVVHEDTDATLIETWQGWTICLEDFTDQGVNLTRISSIAIGFGDRNNPQPGGTGTVYFDDITLGTDPCPIADDTPFFVDDFESYPLGTFPSAGGWEIVWAGTGENYVTNAHSYSPTKSLQLWGRPSWASVAQKKFSTDAPVIGYEFAILISSIGTGGPGRVEHPGFFSREAYIWGAYYARVIFNHDTGKIEAEDGSILGQWQPGVWYQVKVVLDRSTKTYDVWIDGQLKGEGLTTGRTDTDLIDALGLISAHPGVKVYYDDVSVF